MNCFAHPSVPATATCQVCGRGLCSACSERFNVLSCHACTVNALTTAAKQARRAIITSIVIFLLSSYIIGSMASEAPASRPAAHSPQSNLVQSKQSNGLRRTSISKPVAPIEKRYSPLQAMFVGFDFGAWIVCIYWGFKSQSQGTNGLILVGNSTFWFFYFIMRLVLAAIVGVFVGPRKIYDSVRQLRVANRTLGQIQRGEL